MKFVADLHLHSKYSRAVSQNMTLVNIARWAKLKGINVVATGDFTHPFWFDQLKNELESSENGLYQLRGSSTPGESPPKAGPPLAEKLTPGVIGTASPVYFLLSCEVSSIYSQGGKVRRIHNLFFFSSLAAVEQFNKKLLGRGVNLRSDGRPIVGIGARDLAEIALSCDKKALVIPAHAWTPWFSVFGAFSGFDSIKECFGDMAQYIYGIETGLSSDPAMNWQVGDLDNRAILSFSDAHSLEKMGREATVFEVDEVSYDCIYDAIRSSVLGSQSSTPRDEPSGHSTVSSDRIGSDSNELSDNSRSVSQLTRSVDSGQAGQVTDNKPGLELPYKPGLEDKNGQQKTDNRIAFTIEFYPEEGKYHFTGHRECNFSQSPEETGANGSICPVCKRPLTIGVMHRVKELKTRNSKLETRNSGGVRWVYPTTHSTSSGQAGSGRPPYVSMVPLGEILAESLGQAVATKKVVDQYSTLVGALGSEFNVLLKADLAQIEGLAGARVAEGVGRVRSGKIVVEPGFDGKFGVVRIWQETVGREERDENAQLNLF